MYCPWQYSRQSMTMPGTVRSNAPDCGYVLAGRRAGWSVCRLAATDLRWMLYIHVIITNIGTSQSNQFLIHDNNVRPFIQSPMFESNNTTHYDTITMLWRTDFTQNVSINKNVIKQYLILAFLPYLSEKMSAVIKASITPMFEWNFKFVHNAPLACRKWVHDATGWWLLGNAGKKLIHNASKAAARPDQWWNRV